MIVVVTEARVRSWWTLPRFVALSVRAFVQAKGAPGALGATIRLRGPLVWCTITGWSDEDALTAYVRSGPHLDAMRATRAVTRSTVFARILDAEDWGAVTRPRARAALEASRAAAG